MGPRNRFQGMNSASLCSLAGRYDNPLPPRFLAPIDSLKIPARLKHCTGIQVCPTKHMLVRTILWGGGGGFVDTVQNLDQETKKTPIPKCRLYWCFCLGCCVNFVGSESGQKQSVKLLQNMVYNTTQQPPTHPPQPHTVCIYCPFTLGRRKGWGRSEIR